MTGKHLLLSLRNLRKNFLYALFVIMGLALGITTFLATFQWSAWHLTFDRSFPEKEYIYRLTFEEDHQGFYRHTARILHWKALNRIMFSERFPEIEELGRLAPFRKAAFLVEEQSFYESYAYACDPSFLRIFTPEVILGDPSSLLSEPFTIVLTESTARKYFGDQDPLGQAVDLIHQHETEAVTYAVSAVIRDFPENSHFRISALASFENPMEYEGTAWTYLRLAPGSDPLALESDLEHFIQDHVEATYAEGITPRLQAITDIHLKSHKAREIQPNVRLRTVLIVWIAGMLVFALAWFNFTLMAFSRNQLHIQRLVIQWQMGAGRKEYFKQFAVDNLVVGIISYLVGVLITLILSPVLEKQGGRFMFQDQRMMMVSLGFLLVLIVLSSLATSRISTGRLYRHLQRRYLSSKPGASPDITGRNLFIRSVIVLEFIITFVLVSNLLLIHRQTGFAMDQQLGATAKEAIHLYNLHREIVDRFEVFKNRMMESPHVARVTGSLEEPTGMTMDANTFEIDGLDEGEKQLFLFPVDQEFLRFYDLKILYGSDFPALYDPIDSIEYFVLNETAARMVSGDPAELIGRELKLDFAYEGFIWPGPITGIVEDFHLSGLDDEISPMVIFPKYTWLLCFSVLPAGELEPALDHLRVIWEELFPDFPLEYQSSASLIARLYESELTQIRLLLIFSGLSILISGLGLFALSGFFMQKRIKSSTLKKIHGASIRQILLPELLYYLWLALVSSALSVPISLFLMEKWLRNFKYRIDMPVWIFPACAAILVFFSWISVFYHALRLAKINPVEFIREQ
jgi:putative ABC transport system permease protein